MEYKAHLEKKMLESSAVTATILDAHNRYLDYECALWFNIFRRRRYMGEGKQPRDITVFISAVGTQDWGAQSRTDKHILSRQLEYRVGVCGDTQTSTLRQFMGI